LKSAADEKKNSKLILFTTATCVNCKAAKLMLDDAGIDYTAVDAGDHQDQVAKYGVMQAPTLVAIRSDNTEIMTGIEQIKGFVGKDSH
jgi:ribonucleoside-triphosphate reductase